MKELTIKSGTRAEIISYLREKIKNSVVKQNGWTHILQEGEIYEVKHHTIENQIDTFIDSGSPLVSVSLPIHCGISSFRETFIVTDYATLKLDRVMKRLDDPNIRQKRIDAIKLIMQMEIDAEERWNRILKVVDEFNGMEFSFGDTKAV